MTRSWSRRKKSEKKCGIPPRKSLWTVIRRCALYVKNGLYFQKKEGSPIEKEKKITYCLPEHVTCPDVITRFWYLWVTYGSRAQLISLWFLTFETRARRRSSPCWIFGRKSDIRKKWFGIICFPCRYAPTNASKSYYVLLRRCLILATDSFLIKHFHLSQWV